MNKVTQNKILIVDDVKMNRRLIATILKEDYKIILASNGEQALERARKHLPDLILLDIIMPRMTGHQVLKQLKNDPLTQKIPVVFLTALTSESEEEEGLLMGAVDYITKPFRPAIIRARVAIHMQLIEQHKQLEILTNQDGLTGIYNRRKFDFSLEREWRRSLRNGTPLSVAMIDVDFFKLYNDNYGHGAGDFVLRTIAGILNKNINRAADVCARYGGEEFALILPELNAEGLQKVCEKCRQSIVSLQIPHDFSHAGKHVTVTVGGISGIPNEVFSYNELLTQADNNLYQAKELGRNQTICGEYQRETSQKQEINKVTESMNFSE